TRDEDDSDNENDSQYNYASVEIDQSNARDILFKNSKDRLLNRIYNCVSVQELFNVLNNNISEYNCEHITLTVLVLYDLKKIYDDINHMKQSINISRDFLEQLEKNKSFQKLLKLIKKQIVYFDMDTLSYTLLYLNKLGIGIESPLLQLLSQTLEKKLRKKFSISSASKFLEAAFSEVNLRSYFMSQHLIPLVFNEIESCTSVNKLNDLTISLNKLHNVVTEEYLDKYKKKVEKFIENEIITSEDYKVILQIISFLNYPKWRDKNSLLIAKCILLIKNNLSALNANEIIFLYEIFFKIQEPGEILNELQRCSSKHFHQLDDAITTQKIILLSTIIYFSSPHLRTEFQRILKKYVENCNDLSNLLHLRKLLSHVKISDNQLCELYWDKVLKCLRSDTKNIDLLKLSHSYMNFSIDINNYRHQEFEKEIMKLLEDLIMETNYRFFPQKLANILSFVFIYGNNDTLLEHLVDNLETNWEQLRYIDCLKLALSLRIFSEMDKKYIKLPYAQRIDKVLDKIISKEAEGDGDLWKNNALVKSCIFKNSITTEWTTKLLINYKNFEHLSSKNIENISYCFHMTNTLIPEVVDNDKYPQRVRNNLMQLNRAVCLDYPECNVPWFHQKYIDERVKSIKNKRSSMFAGKIREYLIRTVQNDGTVLENVITPYGYEIDFVIKINSHDGMAVANSECSKK
ncbi:uncharacterized protein BDFB_008114, partial [Asbolus verrucosus]